MTEDADAGQAGDAGQAAGPWEVFSCHMALPSLRRLADRVRALEVLSADDQADVDRVLDPWQRLRVDSRTWVDEFRRVRKMLATASSLARGYQPEDLAPEDTGAD